MSEEETQVVEEQENLQGLDQPTESEEHNDVSQEEQLAEQKKRNDAEYNWAEMRRLMREKDQQIEELRDQFSSIAKRQPSQEEVDELASMAEDDILTVAQAKKLAQKMARSVAQEVLQERDNSTVDERVQMKYPDFADVVTKDNIELLKQTEPELAQTLAEVADPYKKAVAAYKLLKKVAVKNEGPSLERKKAAENSSKPVSVNAVTKQSAIGNAHLFENGLTKELKASLWNEMKQAMKGA